MKTIKITADNLLSVIDINLNDYREVQKALDCDFFESVKTEPMMIFVDESGLIKGLPVNAVGSVLYGTPEHGYPICGDIIFAVPVVEQHRRQSHLRQQQSSPRPVRQPFQ